MPGPDDRREKGALLQTLRVCGAVSWGGAHPADGIPVPRCARKQEGQALPHPPRPARQAAPDREARPALPNPPRPPYAGGSRAQPEPHAGAGLRRARLGPRHGLHPHPPPGWRPEPHGGAGAPASAPLAMLATPGRGLSVPRPLDGAGRLLARGLAITTRAAWHVVVRGRE